MIPTPENSGGIAPVVPDQLRHYLQNEQVMETLTDWRNIGYDAILAMMPEPTTFDTGKDGSVPVRAVVLSPEGGERQDQRIVYTLPHQQAWKPSTFYRAELIRSIVGPDCEMVVFPNNSREAESYYTFNPEEIVQLRNGDFDPLVTRQLGVLEILGVERASVTGYSFTGFSLGGTTALELSGRPNSDLRVDHINADEVPSADGRTEKGLASAFLRSGTFLDQRRALRDSDLPTLYDHILNRRRLLRDYVDFARSQGIPENVALKAAMSGSLEGTLQTARQRHPNAVIKLGRVAGSRLLDPASLEKAVANMSGARLVTYDGVGTHKHTTGDNPVALALMTFDGFGGKRLGA